MVLLQEMTSGMMVFLVGTIGAVATLIAFFVYMFVDAKRKKQLNETLFKIYGK